MGIWKSSQQAQTLSYKGTWNALTNTPTLSDNGTGGALNDYYIVNVANEALDPTIDGIDAFAIGDQIINNGSSW